MNSIQMSFIVSLIAGAECCGTGQTYNRVILVRETTCNNHSLTQGIDEAPVDSLVSMQSPVSTPSEGIA